MATGDKVAATHPRGESNMRLDLIDYAALSIASQYAVEAATRALLSSPKAVAGVATGERWAGSMTANPTGSSDGLFRLDSPVFVGVDANGGMLVKPNGTALAIAIPAGGTNQQVYAYVADVAEDQQVRRFLPATAPFNEFAQAINTALRQTVGLYVRAGSLGSVVAEDVVAGITRPLLFLGIASNTGGVVTFTPGTNTLETVRAPATVPVTDSGTTTAKTTVTGSQNALRDLINAALYAVGNAMFKGSDFVTPADGNNWGAYSTASLSGGIDKAYRQALGYVTIGNGTTVFGDFNTNAYANAKLLLDAAIASLPTAGGTIVIKRGVALSGFGGATVTLPAKYVEIVGTGVRLFGSDQITFTTGESFVCNANGKLVLRNLAMFFDGAAIVQLASGVSAECEIYNCKLGCENSTGAAVSGTNVDHLRIFDTTFVCTPSGGTNQGRGVRITGTANNIRIERIRFIFGDADVSGIELSDVREDVTIDDVVADEVGSGFDGSQFAAIVRLSSTDNATQIRNRRVSRVAFLDPLSTLGIPVRIDNCGNIEITDCQAPGVVVYSGAFAGSGLVTLRQLKGGSVSFNGAVPSLLLIDSTFTGSSQIGGTLLTQGTIAVERCRFTTNGGGVTPLILGADAAERLRVANCTFNGQGSTANNSFSCIRISAASSIAAPVREIEIVRNTISNFQNVAYVGANLDFRMIEINTNGCARLVIDGNEADNIMRTSSGSARAGAYLVEINSRDRASFLCQITDVFITNNRVGSKTMNTALKDYCMLLKGVNWLAEFERVVISGNDLFTIYDTTAGVPLISHQINFNNGGTAAGLFRHMLAIDRNTMRLSGAGPNMPINFAKFIWNEAGGQVNHISFCDNILYYDGGLVNFDAVSAFGADFTFTGGGTLRYMSVLGNEVYEDSFAVGNWFGIKLAGAPAVSTIPSSFPTTGVAFTNNINVKRQ